VAAITIRDMDAEADRAGVEAIDTAFETSVVFELVVAPRRLELVERALAQPLVKRYPIADAFAFWARWDRGWVADDGGIVGFAGVEYEAWHRRLVLWHLYVTRERRGEGIARSLLARVEAYGRELGARRVWLETSTVNVPGVAAYARLGYALCGADETLYDATPMESERAIYLSKPL
jgi:GNAT superfamily N-acetyltransferase